MNFKQLYCFNQFLINLAGYLKYLKLFLFHHRRFSVVKRNIALSNMDNVGKVCYVCALGPSLKNVDLMEIKGDTIVVNDFDLFGINYPDFIPTYYLMVDAAYYIQSCNLPILKRSVDAYINKGTKYLVHSSLEDILGQSYESKSIYYLSQFKGRFNHNKELKIDRVMPSLSNVASTAIGCAIAMGYKKIVLLGCDFNSFAAPVATHCYDEKDNSRKISLGFELFSYSFIAKIHEELAEYAKLHDVTIVNSTKGSLIDAYPFDIDESLYYK